MTTLEREKDPAIKTLNFEHQQRVYDAQRDSPYFALFWEMGLGKTKVIIDVASHLFLRKKIDCLLVIAPNSVYRNWLTDEIPQHMAAPYVGMAYSTYGSGKDDEKYRRLLMLDSAQFPDKLKFVCMSYDSLSKTERGFTFARQMAMIHRTMIVADESTAMRSGATVVSKKMKEVASYCHYKWIATGTPATESPFALHSQIEFLDPEFWKRHGMRSFSAFKHEFGIFEKSYGRGQKPYDELRDYRRLDKLHEIYAPVSDRLLKEDSTVKLPPKLYTVRSFEMTEEQRRVYDELRTQFVAELDCGMTLEAPMAVVRLTRLQQITSGFVTAEEFTELDLSQEELEEDQLMLNLEGDKINIELYENQIDSLKDDITWSTHSGAKFDNDGVILDEVHLVKSTKKTVDVVPPTDNPRLQLLVGILESCHHKAIVFCRFRRDVDLVCDTLGELAVRYDGRVRQRDRVAALRRFKDERDPARFFVANTHAVSMGLTLVIAKTVIYYSNSFSLEKRLQSEDRTHRIGQDKSVQIIDLCAESSVDQRIIKTLREKFEISAQVSGDRLREWL